MTGPDERRRVLLINRSFHPDEEAERARDV